jgi:hypothetical protein
MPATSVLDIWNQAISLCGNSDEVQGLTESSANANACRRFYEQDRDEMMNDFPYPFMKVTIALALVTTDPTDEWAFAYAYPSDCFTIRRIQGVLRNETRQSRVPYLIGRDGDTLLIYTDWENAIAEYTIDGTDTSRFPPSFTKALALKLAVDIAPRITGGDPTKIMDRLEARYARELEECRGNLLNEEQVEELPNSEFTRFREAGDISSPPSLAAVDAWDFPANL